MRASRRRPWLFTAMVALLAISHVVQWQPGDGPWSRMLLGFLPWDLAYHLLWMLAAAGAVFYMTDVLWTHPEDEPR